MRKGGSIYKNSGDKTGPEVAPEIGIQLLQRQIDEARSLISKRPIDSGAYNSWRDATQTYLNKAFGKNQKHLSVHTTAFAVFTGKHERELRIEQEHFDSLKDNIIQLEGFIKLLQTEIEIYSLSKEDTVAPKQGKDVSSTVFIVHGRNEDVKIKVARFIEKAGLKVVILHEEPGGGQTIIEKLENHSLVGYAVVLLTADDVGKSIEETDLRPRARQNVIFELGFFCALLGRKGISVLYENGVEIPTDYSGVEYLPLDGAWQVKLLKELNNAGFKVDFPKALSTI
jgi:predicted nucleotide-binding protein